MTAVSLLGTLAVGNGMCTRMVCPYQQSGTALASGTRNEPGRLTCNTPTNLPNVSCACAFPCRRKPPRLLPQEERSILNALRNSIRLVCLLHNGDIRTRESSVPSSRPSTPQRACRLYQTPCERSRWCVLPSASRARLLHRPLRLGNKNAFVAVVSEQREH